MDDTAAPTSFHLASRIEVIDQNGQRWYGYLSTPGIELQVQDDGQTIKLFAAGFVLGQ